MQADELIQMLQSHELWLKSGGREGQQARLEELNLGVVADLSDLSGADLRDAILNRAGFKDADLTETNFQRAELRRANFDGAILRGTNLRETDLQNANLENAEFLLSAQLAGSNVAGAKLPKPIAGFEGLETIAEATSNAQKLFIAMLGGCLYSWLSIGTTKDAALLTNSESSPLPIIGTALPIVGFYMVAPIVLLALYFYFHLNMQRLWEALADLPAIFPDGRRLDKRADPWLLNGLVSAHFVRLRSDRPSLSRVQQGLSILLAWWIVPATLFVFWGRYLMRHHRLGTCLHIGLLTAAIGFGWMSYRLARATLLGTLRKPFRWAGAWKDMVTYKRVAGVFGILILGVASYQISLNAMEGVPSYVEESRLRLRRVVRSLEVIGFSPIANIVGEDLSTKPANWAGKSEEYVFVKGAPLVRARMQYVRGRSAFLVNADLRGANLSGADFMDANLWKANLDHANLSSANLTNANLSQASLIDADLWNARFQDADLSNANLTNAYLGDSTLIGAILSNANLTDATLRQAYLGGANLSNANLTGADLDGAILTHADLSQVKGLTRKQLQKAIADETTILPADLPP